MKKLVFLMARHALLILFLVYIPLLSAVQLECEYINDIQDKFLDLHINFSDYDKRKKKFRPKYRALEARVKDQFIKFLDSEKMYFTQSDIRNLRKELKNLFKKIETADCSGLNEAYKLYFKRVSERVKFANQYLSHKFALDPTMEIALDPKKRQRPKNIRQINNFHKKYLQYQMANAITASDKEIYEEQEKEAKKNILRNYNRMKKQVKSWNVSLTSKQKKKCYKRKKLKGKVSICKPHRWYSLYLNSFAKGLDPHSGYFSQEDREDFEINMKLSLEGIGASLRSKYGHTTIEKLISGGAAARSGKIKPKDKILSVGQSAKNMVNIFDMDLRDVVSMIRGKKGTSVHLKIMRVRKDKKKKIFTVKLIRDRVNLEDQAASIYYFDQEKEGKKHKVGVILLRSFYGETGGRSLTNDVKKLIKQAREKKISALVLDMSNNGGGSLTEAIELSGLFFAKGNVARQLIKTKSGDRYLTMPDMDDTINYAGPLVVLVNRVSASASEIVSGALKSYKRAVVVGGDHTFGKGSIQSVEHLQTGLGSIKVTVRMFFIPSGYSTQLKGVDSDIRFPSVFSNNEWGEKTLDYFLPEKKIASFISKSAYVSKNGDTWKPVSKDLISTLKKKSLIRIKKSEKFQETAKNLLEQREKRKKGYLTTIAQVFDRAKEDEEKGEKKSDDEDEYVDRDKKYRQRADILEAVNIAIDQVEWEKKQSLAKSNTIFRPK